MKLPDFLVIGAMKAGTTSLCRDLASHPDIYFPPVKEPHTLYLEDVVTPEGIRKYAELFRQAQSGQVCGEGSTGYTKLPYGKEIPVRAKIVCGSGLKLIYIVRNPIDRVLSHHYHAYRAGTVSVDFGEALQQDKTMLTCSQYARQLSPWMDAFGPEQICVIRFEDYVEDQYHVIRQIYRFLGVSPSVEAMQHSRDALNIGEQQAQPPTWLRKSFLFPFWKQFKRGQFYKRSIRPLLQETWIHEVKQRIFTTPPPRPLLPSVEDLNAYIEEIRKDQEQWCVLLGLREPMWDLEASLLKYIAARQGEL